MKEATEWAFQIYNDIEFINQLVLTREHEKNCLGSAFTAAYHSYGGNEIN